MAPYTTVKRVLQGSTFNNINMMNISLRSMDMLDEAKRELTALLRQRHRLADYQDDDFETRDPTEFMNTIGSTTKLMTILLTIAASISLLVGGIGIMNIMLVTLSTTSVMSLTVKSFSFLPSLWRMRSNSVISSLAVVRSSRLCRLISSWLTLLNTLFCNTRLNVV